MARKRPRPGGAEAAAAAASDDEQQQPDEQQHQEQEQQRSEPPEAAEAGAASGSDDEAESDGDDGDAPAAAAAAASLDERRAAKRAAKAAQKKLLSAQKLARLKQAADKRGIVYVSRLPPHMKPAKLRQLLSQYGEVGRVYCAAEDAGDRAKRKRKGGNSGAQPRRAAARGGAALRDCVHAPARTHAAARATDMPLLHAAHCRARAVRCPPARQGVH